MKLGVTFAIDTVCCSVALWLDTVKHASVKARGLKAYCILLPVSEFLLDVPFWPIIKGISE